MNADMLDVLSRIKSRITRISALASNPHWTADRRWTIAELSQGCLEDLALIETLNQRQV